MAQFYSLLLCVILSALEEVSADVSCPGGWTAFDGNCYIYKEEAATFDSAQTVCSDMGGNLVTVDNAAENNFLFELRSLGTVSDAWIGLDDLSSEGTFAWVSSGDEASYTNWKNGEPNNKGGEDCVEMWNSGVWNDKRCRDSRRYFCELELCEDGMYFYRDSCYSYSESKADFASAQTACNNLGGHLVEVNSAEENDFLMGLRSNFEVGDAWIGLSDQGTESAFIWVSSRSSPDFTMWADGEPNDRSGEDCVELFNNGMWNDNGCEVSKNYFCERTES